MGSWLTWLRGGERTGGLRRPQRSASSAGQATAWTRLLANRRTVRHRPTVDGLLEPADFFDDPHEAAAEGCEHVLDLEPLGRRVVEGHRRVGDDDEVGVLRAAARLGDGRVGLLGYLGIAPTVPVLGDGGNTTSFGFLGGIGISYITNEVGPDEGFKPAAFLSVVVQVGQATPQASASGTASVFGSYSGQ